MSARDDGLLMREHLASMVSRPQILWENSEQSVQNSMHLLVEHIPAQPRRLGLSSGVHDSTGILQVTVRTQSGSGMRDAETVAEKIADHFYNFNRSGLRVDTYPAILTGYPDGNWYRIPVQVRYRRLGHP